jgi:hypothetical protein
LVDLLGGPAADVSAAMQQHFEQANDAHVVDFDSRISPSCRRLCRGFRSRTVTLIRPTPITASTCAPPAVLADRSPTGDGGGRSGPLGGRPKVGRHISEALDQRCGLSFPQWRLFRLNFFRLSRSYLRSVLQSRRVIRAAVFQRTMPETH